MFALFRRLVLPSHGLFDAGSFGGVPAEEEDSFENLSDLVIYNYRYVWYSIYDKAT